MHERREAHLATARALTQLYKARDALTAWHPASAEDDADRATALDALTTAALAAKHARKALDRLSARQLE